MPDHPAVRLSRWFLSLLLLAFPPSFRRSMGTDFVAAWTDCCREGLKAEGWRGLTRMWLETALYVPRDAALVWLDTAKLRLSQSERRDRRNHKRGDRMGGTIQDIKYALRSFHKRPAFSLIVLVTVGLGVGASTTVFSIVDGVALRPLPYDNPDRLVMLWSTFGSSEYDSHSYLNYRDLREGSSAFEALVAMDHGSMVIEGSERPEHLESGTVTPGFFAALGYRPLAGRAFLPEDERPDADPVVILSHGVWRRRFGSDTGVLGSPITLDGHQATVVGILPANFLPPEPAFPPDVEVWFPVSQLGEELGDRDSYFLQVIGRLKDDVTLESAQGELDVLATGLAEAYPGSNTLADDPLGVRAMGLQEATVGEVGHILVVLIGAVGLLLLITCANVANLFLVRSADRQREIAVRTALGAARLRILRQLLTESTLLALLGGLLGVGLAFLGVDAFQTLNPGNIPRTAEVVVDLRVLAFAVALSVISGLLFGLAPALLLSAKDANQALKESGRTATSGRHASALRSGLVVTQTAVALTLVVGAGLLMNSFVRLRNVDPGFDPQGVTTMQIAPGPSYDSDEKLIAYFEQLREQLRSIPDARSASFAARLPVSSSGSWGSITSDAASPTDEDEPRFVRYNSVSTDYFRTLGIPLLRGRDILPSDDANSDLVVVINERLAREFWPEGEALGRQLKFGRRESQGAWRTVVGVVGDVKHRSLGDPGESEIYVPFGQRPRAAMYAAVRSRSLSGAVAAAMRDAVWAIDRSVPIDHMTTMRQRVVSSLTTPRFYTVILVSFAATALLLAIVGIYGTISYNVASRNREMGVRIALGANARDIFGLIFRRGIALTSSGIIAGLLGALGVSRFLSSFVFGITPTDPSTFIAVSLALAAVALLACYVPARRATRVDPVVTLRTE